MAPFEVKLTLPVGALPPLTVAVKVTDAPVVDGLSEELRAVEVAIRLADTLRMTLLYWSAM